ncbi:MAG: hypothetical protein U1D30_08240 [Planctomycetota bacterium]
MQLEVVKIPVEKFTTQVGNRPRSNSRSLRSVQRHCRSSERGIIGFEEPAKASAQYLVAKVDQYFDKVKVTEEEVKKYYDEHPEEFQEEPPAAPQEPESKAAIPAPPEEKELRGPCPSAGYAERKQGGPHEE